MTPADRFSQQVQDAIHTLGPARALEIVATRFRQFSQMEGIFNDMRPFYKEAADALMLAANKAEEAKRPFGRKLGRQEEQS